MFVPYAEGDINSSFASFKVKDAQKSDHDGANIFISQCKKFCKQDRFVSSETIESIVTKLHIASTLDNFRSFAARSLSLKSPRLKRWEEELKFQLLSTFDVRLEPESEIRCNRREFQRRAKNDL